MRRVLAIAHHSDYDPGLIEIAANSHGFELVMAAREDQTLPDPLEFELILSFGSAWSIARGEHPEAVDHEQRHLRRAHGQGVPILGICFGGQQLAAALGGRVTRSADPEIGPTWIESHDALIDAGPWLQFHFDEFDAPPGSRVLATTTCVQAFTIGRSMGVQFHPEVTTATVQRWVSMGGDKVLQQVGVSAEELLARCIANETRAQARTTEFFAGFLRFAGLVTEALTR